MEYRYWACRSSISASQFTGLSQLSIMRFFGRDTSTPWSKSTTVVYPQDFEMNDSRRVVAYIVQLIPKVGRAHPLAEVLGLIPYQSTWHQQQRFSCRLPSKPGLNFKLYSKLEVSLSLQPGLLQMTHNHLMTPFHEKRNLSARPTDQHGNPQGRLGPNRNYSFP